MFNPILQSLQNRQHNNQMTLMQALRNPQGAFNQMMQSNPQFAQFVRDNKGKNPEQIAMEHGIDLNALKNMMR